MLSLQKFKEIKSRISEGLKGDQHQLDHDKDGKIEGEDLAKLHKKMKKEEAEQLDELSTKTLRSYVDKVATTSGRGTSPDGKLKSIKAIGGVTKAIRKQYSGSNVKEESEQLDELSKDALRSYKHKAELSIPKDDKAYSNRSKGIDKAEKKLKNEEKFDPLKHVKNPTAGEKKASKDVKRGSYADRAAMLRSAQNDGRLKESHPFDEFTSEQIEQFIQTEDYEQLDELSKSTLGSYVKKSHSQLKAHATNIAFKSGRGDSDALSTMTKSADKEQRREKGLSKAVNKLTKEAAQYPRAAHTDVKDVAAARAPAEQQHAAMHKVTVKNGIPDKHEDGTDKVKGAAKLQPVPKKNYVEDPQVNKDIYIQSFRSYVQMKGDLERM